MIVRGVGGGAEAGQPICKKGMFFIMSLTLTEPISKRMDSWEIPLNFGYYIKTENYEVFIPKIAREVYDLEHRKLRKRKLRGRKLRGYSVCYFYEFFNVM